MQVYNSNLGRYKYYDKSTHGLPRQYLPFFYNITPKGDENMTQQTINQVLQFRDDRDWRQFHNPKDLAISLSLEAAELLEVFQWSAEDLHCEEKMDKIREELADVVSYCILMADACGLDLDEIVQIGRAHV